MLQNATPLRKSAPGPPDSSDEHVSCTAPATENASFQILFKCPTPAIGFGNSTKPSRFCFIFDTVHSPLRLPRETTLQSPKVVRASDAFHILTAKCASRHKGCIFRHLNFHKWSEAGVFCTFSLWNVLRATTSCTFSTSQLPKVVRKWDAFSFFTCTCASRHNGMHFFDIATAKSGQDLLCFVYVDPRGTTACNFSSLIWPDGSAPAALASLLFDPPEPFRDFPTFSRICIFFLLTRSLLWSSLFYSSLLSDSSHLCFSSVHIVGSLTSKLPSIIWLHMCVCMLYKLWQGMSPLFHPQVIYLPLLLPPPPVSMWPGSEWRPPDSRTVVVGPTMDRLTINESRA